MYITIEGPEATGKTTQVGLLAEKLKKAGKQVLVTKEPGSPHDKVCQSIRSLLLNPDHNISSTCALFLFLADRSQHMQTVKKALADGMVVISDRSSISSFVYHTAETRDIVKEEEDAVLCNLLDMAQQRNPDLCFICYANKDWSLDRLKSRAELDRIEKFSSDFHARTYSLFDNNNVMKICKMMRYAPQRIFSTPLASSNSIEQVSEFIYRKTVEAGV